jgi:cell division inhibitor SepF
MSGMWHRTLVYLGLKEEPEEDYDDPPERLVANGDEGVPAHTDDRGDVIVRPLRPAPEADEPPAREAVRVAIVEIQGFEDVEGVGARYRTGQPVVFDAAATDAATARRVLDFVAGMTYALHGKLDKVGGKAFLLVPDGVRISETELRRLAAAGYRVPTGSKA